jgi:uncharacterized protein (UPF0128 family)
VVKYDSKSQKYKFAIEGEIPSICFPGDELSNLKFVEQNDAEQLTISNQDKLKVTIEINYKNKLTQIVHHTKRSYSTEFNHEEQRQPIPLRETDYWD